MFYGLSKFFKDILPKRLFYRALLIVAVPVIVLQLVITIVFFDSLCPICSKELKYLTKRKQTGKVNYYEITSKSDFERDVKEVDFLSAMKEIHALDYQGKGHACMSASF